MAIASCELEKDIAEKFKAYLKAEGIKYEPSECFNLINICVMGTVEELKKANDYLESL